MDVRNIPVFALLQNKLAYSAERQKLIAQNVANASTPGFTPNDLKPFEEQPGVNKRADAGVMAPPAATDSGSSLTGVSGRSRAVVSNAYLAQASPDSETTLDGNQVVLEEQMIKMSEARDEYESAIALYQKAMNMLHVAVKKPGA